MLNWLLNKLNPKKNTENIEKNKVIYLPGTKISYDESLIPKFKHDHQELLAIYTQCAQAYDNDKHLKLNQLLKKFKTKLTSHLLVENVKFYIYVSHYYKDDEVTKTLIQSFRREMEGIGKAAFKFLTEYTANEAVYNAKFKEKFDAIGGVLGDRISSEENELYMLYAPPNDHC